MAGPSSWTSDAFLNLLFRGVAFPSLPSDLWLSAHTDDPGDTGANEVTASGYQRIAIARSTTAWSAPGDGTGGVREITSASNLTFPNPTANWGTITHLGVWDASSGGQFLWSFQLPSPVSITAGGNPLQVTAGQLRAQHTRG